MDYDFECAGRARVKLWESFTRPCDHPDLGPKYRGGEAVLCIPVLEQGGGISRE